MALAVKNSCQCRRGKRCRINPWVGKIPWRRAWQPTPVFSPVESHGQRNLVGYSPWGRTKSDMTKATQHAPVSLQRERKPKIQLCMQLCLLFHKHYHNSTLKWQHQYTYPHFHYASASHRLCYCLTSMMPSVVEITQRSISSMRLIAMEGLSRELPFCRSLMSWEWTAWIAKRWAVYRRLGKDNQRGNKANTQPAATVASALICA